MKMMAMAAFAGALIACPGTAAAQTAPSANMNAVDPDALCFLLTATVGSLTKKSNMATKPEAVELIRRMDGAIHFYTALLTARYRDDQLISVMRNAHIAFEAIPQDQWAERSVDCLDPVTKSIARMTGALRAVAASD